jgi:tripartite-type tricarboxylate transporter receptor subunit TctC
MMMMSVALARPHLDSGALRALAVTSEQRLPALPQVPTVVEAGVPGFQTSAWQGVIAPAGTPREIIERVQRAYRSALEIASAREAVGNLGMLIRASSPEAFGAFLRSEIETWSRVVREANIRPE